MSSLNVALPGADDTTWQDDPFGADTYLSFVPQVSFATARINQAFFSSPLYELAVDSTSAAWSSVVKGMTVWIGSTAGAHDLWVGRVRETPGVSTLYVMEMDSGDPGLLAVLEAQPLVDNAYVTIILDHNAWSVFPLIDYGGGTSATFYKDRDDAYSDQHENPACPVRLGPHKPGWVDAGTGFLNHTFTPTIDPFDGATITGHAWFVDEVAAGTGSSLNYNYDAGHHLVRYVATLSNGRVLTFIRHVWAHDADDYPPIQIKAIGNDRRDRQGRRMSLDIRAEDFEADLMRGSLVCIWDDVDATCDIDSATTQFTGFVESISSSVEPGLPVVSLEVVSPLGIVAKLVAFSQQLSVAANPATWNEALASLMHLDYFAYQLFEYHSTLTRLFDFYPSGATGYLAQTWQVDGGNIVDQLNRTADDIGAELTQASDGSLWLRRNPALLEDRSAVIERCTLTTRHIRRVVSVKHNLRPRYGSVDAQGFLSSTAAAFLVLSRAAGKAGGQGAQQEKLEGQIALSQVDLNERTGHRLAELNNPYASIVVELVRGYDLIEPALWHFVTLDLPADVWPEGVAFHARCVVTDVSKRYNENGTRTLTLTLVPETSGQPGVAMPLRTEGSEDDLILPTINALTGLMLPSIPLWTLPPVYGAPLYGENETLEGSESGYAERPEVVVFAVTEVYYTADRTAGAGSPTWTQRGTTAALFTAMVAEKNSRTGLYALESDELYYSANLATTNLSAVASGLGDALLMRVTAAGHLVIVDENNTDNRLWYWNGSALSGPTTVDTYRSEAALDVDDFGQGVVVVAADRQLHYRTSYSSGSFTQMSGLTGVTGLAGAEITMIRIPHQKASGALNNNKASMELYYSVYWTGLYRATYNFNTNALISISSNLSPLISGNPTGVMAFPDTASGHNSLGESFESYAGDSRRLIGVFRNASSAGLFKSLDAGANWTEVGSGVTPHAVHFVEPVRGGNGRKILTLYTTAQASYTDDFFATATLFDLPVFDNPQLQRGIVQL